jgi:CRISPR-associated protein Cst1
VIRYTGNPYVDAGVAVLELRLHKACDQFTPSDLEAQAEQIKTEYRRKIWKSYLTVHFMNCAWVQHKISPEKERAYIAKVLESYKSNAIDPPRACAFCGSPANTIVDRSHVPLLTGETVMVAGADGRPGLPTCGFCVFAIHFYPLATLKVAGRPLFWWASEPEWMRRLTNRFRSDIEKVLAASTEQFANVDWPSTRLMHAARDVVDEMGKVPRDRRPPLRDIVGVHATNLGAGPDYGELRIPSGLLEFWSEAGTFGSIYAQVESDAWETREKKPRKYKNENANAKKKAEPPTELVRRNLFFEALGKAFISSDYRDEAKQVAVKFFLRSSGKHVAPNTTALAEFFLEKVARMERQRLEAIRQISDLIAEQLILGSGNSRAVEPIFRRRMKLGEFIRWLSQIQRSLSDIGHPLPWDNVLLALDLASDEDRTARDYWLVQELVLIRLLERAATSPVLATLPEPEAVQQEIEVSE